MSNQLIRTPLCSLADIADPGSKGFCQPINGNECEFFVVRKGLQAYAYINSCPHTGGPLDWTPGRFLNESNNHIICAAHAAEFQVEDGFCMAGPCAGQSLIPLRINIDDGMIYLI